MESRPSGTPRDEGTRMKVAHRDGPRKGDFEARGTSAAQGSLASAEDSGGALGTTAETPGRRGVCFGPLRLGALSPSAESTVQALNSPAAWINPAA